jgi:hypothetical protein
MKALMGDFNRAYCCDVKQFDAGHSEYIKPLEAVMIGYLYGTTVSEVLRDHLYEHYVMNTGCSEWRVHPFNNSGNKRTSELNAMLNKGIYAATCKALDGTFAGSTFCVEGDDSIVFTNTLNTNRSFVARNLGMQCEDQWHDVSANTADFLNNTVLETGQLRPRIERLPIKQGTTCKKVHGSVTRHEIGMAADISRILSKAPCQSGYNYLRVCLRVRISEMEKGLKLVEHRFKLNRFRKRVRRLIATFESFHSRLSLPVPKFGKDDLTELNRMTRDTKESLHKTQNIMFEPA